MRCRVVDEPRPFPAAPKIGCVRSLPAGELALVRADILAASSSDALAGCRGAVVFGLGAELLDRNDIVRRPDLISIAALALHGTSGAMPSSRALTNHQR